MSNQRAVVPYRPTRQAAPARRPGKRGLNAAGLLLVVILTVPMLVLIMPTSVLLLIGMAPTIVALIVDRDPDRYAAITVGPLNFCGVLPAAMTLWQGSHTVSEALRILADPSCWLVMYGAAGAGWLIYMAVPPVVAGYLIQRHEGEIRRLRKRQEAMVAEWGKAITGEAQPSQQ